MINSGNNNNGSGPPKVTTKWVGNDSEVLNYNNDWWNSDDEDLFNDVNSVVDNIQQNQSAQTSNNIKYARLYANLELLGMIGGGVNFNQSSRGARNRVTYNVVKSAIDTAASKISKNKPKPQFLTDGGDWNQQQRAKKLTKYVEGVFYDTKAYELGQKSFTKGGVFGTGGIKVYVKDGRIQLDDVFTNELVVDDYDGAYGKPRQLHQIKYVARTVLLDKYPDHVNAIRNASTGFTSDQNYRTTVDMVKVIESWHLPSSKEGTDGRHAITIDTGTLMSEEYKKEYFPFVFFRWSERLLGFFGQGLAEELVGVQLEINKLLKNIQISQHLMAVPRVAVDQKSKLSVSQLNNELGAVFKYSGNAPQFFVAQAMSAEVYNHLKWLIQSAYEITGISQLSATSQKPSGLDSGAAIREYQDIETERFMVTAMRYEQMFMDLAKIIIDMSRDLYEDNKDLQISVPGGSFIETIKWKDVNLRDDQFIMKSWPVSWLPSSPAGRLAKVQELLQAGFISRENALQMLDFPDLEKYEGLETASNNLTEKQINGMLDGGDFVVPEPEQNLLYCEAYATKAYIDGIIRKVPEENLEKIHRYIDHVKAMIKAAKEAEAPPAQPQPTMAQPEALPQSDMIPNVQV